jgi:hypothetical protein
MVARIRAVPIGGGLARLAGVLVGALVASALSSTAALAQVSPNATVTPVRNTGGFVYILAFLMAVAGVVVVVVVAALYLRYAPRFQRTEGGGPSSSLLRQCPLRPPPPRPPLGPRRPQERPHPSPRRQQQPRRQQRHPRPQRHPRRQQHPQRCRREQPPRRQRRANARTWSSTKRCSMRSSPSCSPPARIGESPRVRPGALP